MAETSTQEIMLGRYHAREVTLAQLQRRRLEAAEKLSAARKEMKATKSAAPPEEEGKAAHTAWLVKIGEHSNKIDKLAAEKASAEQALNTHIGGRALPLFAAEPEAVARDCIAGGIALLFEQAYEVARIKEMIGHEFDIASFRWAFEATSAANQDEAAQGLLFPAERDRGELERSLAYLLGPNLPRPAPFSWIEIAAHLTDHELGAAWAWAAAPHKFDQPQCLVDVLAGKLERFEHDPKLPTTVVLSAEAAERIGRHLSIEIDETGLVTLIPAGEPAQQLGKIEPSQMLVPVWVALRMIAGAANSRWVTTRDDWTWRDRAKAKQDIEGMSGLDNGGLGEGPEDGEEGGDAEGKARAPQLAKKAVVDKLKVHNGNLKEAGAALGVSRDALRRRCKALGVDPDDYRSKS